MKKRNIIAVFAALAAALVLFAACGKNGDDEPEVSTVIGEDGRVYEEETEVQTEIVTEIVTELKTEVVTNKKGEAVTNKEGKTEVVSEVVSEVKSEVVTTVVTVTKPYVPPTTTATTAKGEESSAATTQAGITVPNTTSVDGIPWGGATGEVIAGEGLMKQILTASKERRQLFISCKVISSMDGSSPTEIPIKVYVKNNNMALEYTLGKASVRMVTANGQLNLVFPAVKYYCAIGDASSAEAGGVDYAIWEALGSDTMKYDRTEKVTMNKSQYKCEYYIGDGTVNRYYFTATGKLVRIEIEASDGTISIMSVDDYATTVSDSVFEIPGNYTKISEDKLESLMGSMGGLV